MRESVIKLFVAAPLAFLFIIASISGSPAQNPKKKWSPIIPKTWDDEAVASIELPLPYARYSPTHVSSDYYYSIPVRPIYKDYAIYRPDKEPPGYMEWLKRQEPQIVAFDTSKLATEDEWAKAGENVFDAPIAYDAGTILAVVRDPLWYEQVRVPVTKDGVFPYGRYVIREKGKVEVGIGACSNCHTRVMPDGGIIKGAQGNFPLDRSTAFEIRLESGKAKDGKEFLERNLYLERGAFSAPWLQSADPYARRKQMSLEEIISSYEAIPPGVLSRQRSSVDHPPRVPDLIGVKEIRYLDSSGLVRHRGIGDLMRYAALNQGADALSRFGDFVPGAEDFKTLPEPTTQSRYSDEQLYALALYIYSLKPPQNPNRFDALAARGKKIFESEGCAVCHTPPLYTNNRLTPAKGFEVTEEHRTKFDVMMTSVSTDSSLTLNTRRGTGYYKVPSLRGVWYRGPFEHNGSVATLEDWFDPRRLKDDYVPTGFRGYGVKTRAVKGHAFGLDLSVENRKALVAFLKTL